MHPKQSLKLFVGGLDESITENDLAVYFGRFGRVVDKQIKMDQKTLRSRGFGFVSFKQPESVAEVFATQPHFINGCKIDCKPAKSKEESQQESIELRGTNRKIFVSNIPKNSTHNEVLQLFGQFGPIEDLNLMYKKKETGFCYITFSNQEAAYFALHQTNLWLRKHLLKIAVAIPKESVPAGVKIPLSDIDNKPDIKVDSRQMTRSSLNDDPLSPQRKVGQQNFHDVIRPERIEMRDRYLVHDNFGSGPVHTQTYNRFNDSTHYNGAPFAEPEHQYVPRDYQRFDSSAQVVSMQPSAISTKHFVRNEGLHEQRHGSPKKAEHEEQHSFAVPRNMRLLSSHVMGVSASKADDGIFGDDPLAGAARGRYSFDIDHTSQQHLLVPAVVPSSRYKLSTLRRLHECAIPEQLEVPDTSVCPSEADAEPAKRSLLNSTPASPGQPKQQYNVAEASGFNFIENDFKFKVESVSPASNKAAALIQEIQHLRRKLRLLEEEKLRIEAELVFDDQGL